MEKIMENFYNQGFNNFKVIINYKKELIKTYIKEIDHPYKIDFIDIPSKRKIHKGNIPVVGGISIYFSGLQCSTSGVKRCHWHSSTQEIARYDKG